MTIETACANLVEPDGDHRPPTRPGPYGVLAVSDTGTGMDAEVQSRLFEPFFTTKPVGQGAGLGLATVYGTVTQAGGSVSVQSVHGRGTTLRLWLPRAAGTATAAPAADLDPWPRGAETVLVAEDDRELRELVRETLELSGYRVLAAADPAEALALAERSPAPVDLLLTDLAMPGASGCDLAVRLAARQAGLRTLYMSGLPPEAARRLGLGQEVPYLQKPVGLGALLHPVREVLDGPAREPGP